MCFATTCGADDWNEAMRIGADSSVHNLGSGITWPTKSERSDKTTEANLFSASQRDKNIIHKRIAARMVIITRSQSCMEVFIRFCCWKLVFSNLELTNQRSQVGFLDSPNGLNSTLCNIHCSDWCPCCSQPLVFVSYVATELKFVRELEWSLE